MTFKQGQNEDEGKDNSDNSSAFIGCRRDLLIVCQLSSSSESKNSDLRGALPPRRGVVVRLLLALMLARSLIRWRVG